VQDNFIVGLTDVSPAITAPTLWGYTVCAQYPGVVGEGVTVYLPCTSCMPPHRYLIVQTEAIGWQINICEIEVYVRGKNSSLLVSPSRRDYTDKIIGIFRVVWHELTRYQLTI